MRKESYWNLVQKQDVIAKEVFHEQFAKVWLSQ